MNKTISKNELFQALATGGKLTSLGLSVVNGIEREDSTNRSYIVKGYSLKGQKISVCVKTN